MSKKVWVGDCDHDPDQRGWVDEKTGKKPKVTTFKSVAKRMKVQKSKPLTKQQQDDWFDQRFDDMKDDDYWGY